MLVCGGRDFTDEGFIFAEMERLHRKHQFTELIHGDAPGVDRIAARWAYRMAGIEVTPYPADWERHGRSAGPKRNAFMLHNAGAEMLVAFPGGKGTADMVGRARKAGLRVITAKP